jgi:hypothetical protein
MDKEDGVNQAQYEGQEKPLNRSTPDPVLHSWLDFE